MSFFVRVKNSVNSRLVRPYMETHYNKTKYGRLIASLKNKYAGKRCFLVGNGPSLKAEDLTLLHQNNEITFGFNRIYNIFDKTSWRPTFYISQDEKMLGGCIDDVNSMKIEHKFVPAQLNWYFDIKINEAIYFNIVSQISENPEEYLFSDDASKCLYNSSTGMYTAAQLAVYMGFKEIYFIGVDHHFRTSMNNKGEIVVDNTVKDYFTEKYNEDKKDLYIPNTEKSTLTYVAMKNHCEQRNVSVLNATRGGKLEVFERVNFDKLFIKE